MALVTRIREEAEIAVASRSFEAQGKRVALPGTAKTVKGIR